MENHCALPISDPSDPGAARRLAVSLAGRVGLDATDTGRVALVVTEASTNIIKHADKGQILLRRTSEAFEAPGIELIALDQGPGMADVKRCFEDGYSTAGSPGTGLGAVSRLASFVDIYTAVGLGTALLARVHPPAFKSKAASRAGLSVGAVRVPAPNETVCGDDWSLVPSSCGAKLLLADGLGHGPEAAKASAEAVRTFEAKSHLPFDSLLLELHRALKTTRGAAASCVEIDLEAKSVQFAGVGNVAGMIASPTSSQGIVTQNGTLGAHMGRVRTISLPLPAGGSLIMHTDGLNSHVSTQGYPGLLARDPSLVAGVLYRDFVRGRDDATVVVCQTPETGT